MNPARDGHGWHQKTSDQSSSERTPESSLDESYWAALLQEGETVALDGPPPWIGELEVGPIRSIDGCDPEPDDWQRAAECLNGKTCCELSVVGYNRGGLLVQFGLLTGFVPGSHLVGFPVYADSPQREEALLHRVGRPARCVVIEVDRSRNRLILSERAALEHGDQDRVIAGLKAGNIVNGRVSNLRRFGAFVDLGGFEGLIHISEMSWGRVNHPGDVVQPGDEVQVCVLDVNPEERKVQLSLKRLQPDPWREVEGRYVVGELVEGEVTNVVSFGAFVRLEEGVEGLIHISELAEGNFLHPRNVVREREWVSARILNIDPTNRRIGLSLRQANQAQPRRDGRENATADSDITSSQAATPSW